MIYMRAGYIAVLGTLFLYACLLSWRKHRLSQAVARAEASRDAGRPGPVVPAGETSAGETSAGETSWRQAGVVLADAAPSPDGSPVVREAPAVVREVPAEPGR